MRFKYITFIVITICILYFIIKYKDNKATEHISIEYCEPKKIKVGKNSYDASKPIIINLDKNTVFVDNEKNMLLSKIIENKKNKQDFVIAIENEDKDILEKIKVVDNDINMNIPEERILLLIYNNGKLVTQQMIKEFTIAH